MGVTGRERSQKYGNEVGSRGQGEAGGQGHGSVAQEEHDQRDDQTVDIVQVGKQQNQCRRPGQAHQ